MTDTRNFGEIQTAAKFRDVMRKMTQREINKTYPPDEFGVVDSVDTDSVWVLVTGTDDPISVPLVGTAPSPGDEVRITGRAGSRYIAGSGGGGGADDDIEGGEVISYDPTTGIASVLLDNGDTVDVSFFIASSSPATLTPIAPTVPITLFSSLAPSSSYSWTSIDLTAFDAVAGLITRFTVHSASVTTWAIKVTSQPSGAGENMLEANGIGANDYILSWPWWWANEDTPQAPTFYIGIKNLGAANSAITVTDFRGLRVQGVDV